MIAVIVTGFLALVILILVGLYTRKHIGKSTMIVAICALCLSVVVGYGIFSVISKQYSKTISIAVMQQKNENSQGVDIGIKAITIGESQLDLSDSNYADKWIYQNSTLSWGNSAQTKIDITVPKYSNIEIQFVSNLWAGMVEVNDGLNAQVIDLYSPADTLQTVTIERENGDLLYSFAIKVAVLIALSTLIIFAICLVVGRYVKQKVNGTCVYKLKAWICNNPYTVARVAVICCAFVVMLFFAGKLSLWADDLATIQFVSEQDTLSQNIESISAEAVYNPPFFYLLAYIWLRIAPYGTVWIKLLNIIIVCVGAWLCGTVAKKIKGDRAALISTILAATSYYIISHAAYTFRCFGTMFLLGTLLILAYFKRISSDSVRAYVLYGAVCTLLLYTSYISVALLGIIGLYDCWLFAKNKINGKFLFSYLGAGAIFLPLILSTAQGIVENHTNFWPQTPDIGTLISLIYTLVNNDIVLLSMFCALVFIGILAAYSDKCRNYFEFTKNHATIIMIMPWLAIGLVFLAYIYSVYVNPQGSIFVFRYFTVISPAIFISISIALDCLISSLVETYSLNQKRCVAFFACLVLFVINMNYNITQLKAFPGTINSPYEQAIEWIYKRNDALNTDTLVVMTGYQGGLYYYGTHNFQRENLNFGTLTKDNWQSYKVVYVSPIHGLLSEESNQILQEHYEEVAKNEALYVTVYRQK